MGPVGAGLLLLPHTPLIRLRLESVCPVVVTLDSMTAGSVSNSLRITDYYISWLMAGGFGVTVG